MLKKGTHACVRVCVFMCVHACARVFSASERMEPVIEFLKKQPLFSSVRKNMGIDLGAKLVFQYAIKSQYILRQGERDTNNLYMIYKGTAHAEYYSAQTGSVMTSDKVEPGHVLGTHAVVHYRHNITSVVAQSDCKLIAIPRKLLVELDLLRVLEQSELTSADGKQRASTDFEKLLENVFRVFDKDADGYLSKEELVKGLRTLGYSYSQQDAELAFSRFQSFAESNEGSVDFHCFKDFWMSCNFIDPLNMQALEKEDEQEVSSASLDAEFYEDIYGEISRETASNEIESEMEKVMLEKASEARSIWMDHGEETFLMDKVHIRMMLVDLRSEQCSANAVERLLANELADLQRSQDGLIEFEDFVSWWMMHNAELFHAHQERQHKMRQRQQTMRVRVGANNISSPTSDSPRASSGSMLLFSPSSSSPAPSPLGPGNSQIMHIGSTDQLSSMDMPEKPAQLVPEASRHHPSVELGEGLPFLSVKSRFSLVFIVSTVSPCCTLAWGRVDDGVDSAGVGRSSARHFRAAVRGVLWQETPSLAYAALLYIRQGSHASPRSCKDPRLR